MSSRDKKSLADREKFPATLKIGIQALSYCILKLSGKNEKEVQYRIEKELIVVDSESNPIH